MYALSIINKFITENILKYEYSTLRQQLSSYSVKLLNNVRGRDELEIVLNKTGKENVEKYDQLARLDLALRYQEKPVRIQIKYNEYRME